MLHRDPDTTAGECDGTAQDFQAEKCALRGRVLGGPRQRILHNGVLRKSPAAL